MENPPVATASTQSRERLTAVKQALRSLGFNKQVSTGTCIESVYSKGIGNENLKSVNEVCMPLVIKFSPLSQKKKKTKNSV